MKIRWFLRNLQNLVTFENMVIFTKSPLAPSDDFYTIMWSPSLPQLVLPGSGITQPVPALRSATAASRVRGRRRGQGETQGRYRCPGLAWSLGTSRRSSDPRQANDRIEELGGQLTGEMGGAGDEPALCRKPRRLQKQIYSLASPYQVATFSSSYSTDNS